MRPAETHGDQLKQLPLPTPSILDHFGQAFCLWILDDVGTSASKFRWCFSRWWFHFFFNFQPYLGKWSNLTNIFQMGLNNHQLVLEDDWDDLASSSGHRRSANSAERPSNWSSLSFRRCEQRQVRSLLTHTLLYRLRGGILTKKHTYHPKEKWFKGILHQDLMIRSMIFLEFTKDTGRYPPGIYVAEDWLKAPSFHPGDDDIDGMWGGGE